MEQINWDPSMPRMPGTDWDDAYITLCEGILAQKHLHESRHSKTKKVHPISVQFNLTEGVPLLTSKKVNWRAAVHDMLWIYQVASNDTQWLRDRGVKIWDEWTFDANGEYTCPKGHRYQGQPGTIGTSYGYINKKYKLMEQIINKLIFNPQDRRMVLSLWQEEDLKTAILPPCVWSVQFNVTVNEEGKNVLNATVTQRSADVALGLPFDVTAHGVLCHMLCAAYNYIPGVMLYVVNDPHISENQFEGIQKQINMYRNAGSPATPKFWIKNDIEDFFAFDNSKDLADFGFEDYKYNMVVKMPVSV